jgi:dolichol kinase
LAGVFLTVALVPYPDIVLASLWYLALGDGVAGLVGRNWGHIRLGSKSLEGSLSCFLACWAVGTICLAPDAGSPEVIAGALVATVLEILPLPLNDNLWIPLLSGLFLTALRGF